MHVLGRHLPGKYQLQQDYTGIRSRSREGRGSSPELLMHATSPLHNHQLLISQKSCKVDLFTFIFSRGKWALRDTCSLPKVIQLVSAGASVSTKSTPTTWAPSPAHAALLLGSGLTLRDEETKADGCTTNRHAAARITSIKHGTCVPRTCFCSLTTWMV